MSPPPELQNLLDRRAIDDLLARYCRALGRYLDAFERREGEWRIVRRKYALDWTQSFDNGLAPFRAGRMSMPILDIHESGHPDYRPL